MSVRALRKRDTQHNQGPSSSAKATLFKKASSSSSSNNNNNNHTVPSITVTTSSQRCSIASSSSSGSISSAQRRTHSSPDLRRELKRLPGNNLLRSKSAGDVSSAALAGKSLRGLKAINAKSEVCLQRISSHSYEPEQQHSKMLSGARSHRDLTEEGRSLQQQEHEQQQQQQLQSSRRRMSECSLGYSQSSRRASSMFASQMTLSSSGGALPPVDPNAPLRVPIIGYEVMEERARFTVYKLRVENPDTNDCWLVMRRYTDFVRLNGKLKQAFPHVNLLLPRKKLFGDNFNAVFLDNRVQGLQMFVNSIMAKDQLRQCKLVREFFCLDEPPSYSESMEECRAIFEAQEETIAHLKLQIQNKNDLILSLQQKLRDEMLEKEQLREQLKNLNLDCSHCSSANDSLALK
ncbi:hypothetical protein KR222_007887 [Zaprionus bogoriensis]|nr:hypothetical protein KR222_007887 [Zaprionus bogoriensis]